VKHQQRPVAYATFDELRASISAIYSSSYDVSMWSAEEARRSGKSPSLD
jgi:hypothetical protein